MKYISNGKMTIKEIANILIVSDETIRRSILKLFPDILKNGKKTYLDELQVTAIKRDIINHDLHKNVEVTTELEQMMIIQKGYQALMEKTAELEELLYSAQPKIHFYDTVVDSKDAIEMSVVAKMLDKEIGRNKLFELLREKQILRQNNEPYQKYIDDGWFRVIENYWVDSAGESHIKTKTLVYQKGIEKL